MYHFIEIVGKTEDLKYFKWKLEVGKKHNKIKRIPDAESKLKEVIEEMRSQRTITEDVEDDSENKKDVRQEMKSIGGFKNLFRKISKLKKRKFFYKKEDDPFYEVFREKRKKKKTDFLRLVEFEDEVELEIKPVYCKTLIPLKKEAGKFSTENRENEGERS